VHPFYACKVEHQKFMKISLAGSLYLPVECHRPDSTAIYYVPAAVPSKGDSESWLSAVNLADLLKPARYCFGHWRDSVTRFYTRGFFSSINNSSGPDSRAKPFRIWLCIRQDNRFKNRQNRIPRSQWDCGIRLFCSEFPLCFLVTIQSVCDVYLCMVFAMVSL
jgi:hypothetical protein